MMLWCNQSDVLYLSTDRRTYPILPYLFFLSWSISLQFQSSIRIHILFFLSERNGNRTLFNSCDTWQSAETDPHRSVSASCSASRRIMSSGNRSRTLGSRGQMMGILLGARRRVTGEDGPWIEEWQNTSSAEQGKRV